MLKKIIFLDFDGVINTIYFDENGKSTLGHLSTHKINNWQAICWLNELYKEVPYDIVISSIWRLFGMTPEYIENNKETSLLTTKDIEDIISKEHTTRGREIDMWLKENKKIPIDDFIILDDDSDMWIHKNHLIQTTQAGFTINEYQECLNRWKIIKKEKVNEKIYYRSRNLKRGSTKALCRF